MKSILLPIALLVVAAPGQAQETRYIRLGQSIPGTLTADAEHQYAFDLGANTFVYGQANQLTVDVIVTIRDPDGDQIGRFDGPGRGPEKFTFESEAAGRYVIEVTPFEEGAGDYVLGVLRTERIATNPRSRIDQLMMPYDDDETPGVVIGVVQDGRLRVVRQYGMANLTHGIPFTPETISNIGSVTKQFTAMGLLLLQANGKLSLEDDIRKYIPELPDFGTPITLHNLLNHTGGYREIYNLLPMTGYQGEDGLSRDMAIQIVQRQPDLQAAPNTEFNYNNTGYILLATVIERVTDQSYPDYMKENVFTPLGMTHTRVKAYQGEVIPGSAQGYVSAEAGGYRSVRDLAASYGAGGIYTTVQDLARWMLNYRDKTLGGEDAIAAMTTNTILESGDSTGYGLGLGLTRHRGRTLWTHTGGDVAHRTYFGYYPELEGGVIVMSNNASFDLRVGRQIAEAFFGDEMEPEGAVAEETEGPAGTMSAERMQAIAGDWRIIGPSASLDIVYTVEDGELFAQATGQPKFQLATTSDSTAEFQGVPASVTFHFKLDGTVDSATHHQGPAVPMVRVEKTSLTTEDLRAYVGRYYSEELETALEIELEDSTLTVHHRRMEPMSLTHQGGEEFGAGFPFGTIRFQRSGNGRVTGFSADNGRTKGVWFRRQ